MSADLAPRGQTALSFAGLLFFGASWGLTLPLTKVAVSTGYQPIGIIFWQFVFSVILIGPMLYFRNLPVPVDGRHLRYYLAIAFIGTLIPNSFSFLAAANLPAGVMSVAIATVPIFSLAIALGAGNEKFRVKRVFGILVGVTALLLIALPEASLPKETKAGWLLVALVAPFCYGIEGNFVASKAPRDTHPMAVLFAASLIGAFIAAPAAWFTGNWINLVAPWTVQDWAIFGSSVAHAVAYSGYMWLVGFAGVVFTAQIAYIVTLSGIGMAMAFLGETYSGWIWMSVMLMILALFLVQPKPEMPEVQEA